MGGRTNDRVHAQRSGGCESRVVHKYGNLAPPPPPPRTFFSRPWRARGDYPARKAWTAAAVRFWFIADKYWCLAKNIHLKSTTGTQNTGATTVTYIILAPPLVSLSIRWVPQYPPPQNLHRINVIIMCVCVKNKCTCTGVAYLGRQWADMWLRFFFPSAKYVFTYHDNFLYITWVYYFL